MRLPKLFRKEIEDEFAQDNFAKLLDWSEKEALLRCEFQFLSLDIPNSGANQKFAHKLNFVPLDVIILHNSNNASVTLNYSKFDATNLDITSTAATRLRCLVGRYQ